MKRIEEYNNTHSIALEEILPLKSYLEDFLKEEKLVVISSSSPRALVTAKGLFRKKLNMVSDDFIEFDLKIFPVPFLHLKFKTWLFISRILWFIGWLKTTRTFAYEYLRAQKCAEFLCATAQEASVALVSHGLLNIFIEKHLKKLGYRRINKIKNNCFSITKLQLNCGE